MVKYSYRFASRSKNMTICVRLSIETMSCGSSLIWTASWSQKYHVQYKEKWHSLELLPLIRCGHDPNLGPQIQKNVCALSLTE